MNQLEPTLVTGKDGLRGHIVQVSEPQTGQNGESQTLIQLDDGQQVFVPTRLLSRQADGSYYLSLARTDLTQTVHGSSTQDNLTIPVIAEELDVQKRQVQTGGVRLNKTVHERTETVDQPLFHDEVQVERVPINQLATAVPGVRYEGDTTIIPVLEEVLVVEKRLMVKEEVRITKRQVSTPTQPQQVTLRTEEVAVEPLTPAQPANWQGQTGTGMDSGVANTGSFAS